MAAFGTPYVSCYLHGTVPSAPVITRTAMRVSTMKFGLFFTTCVLLFNSGCNDTADDRSGGDSAGSTAKSGTSSAAAADDGARAASGSAKTEETVSTVLAGLGGATGVSSAATAAPSLSGKETKTESGLAYLDLEVGSGAALERGQTALVHATGWLQDGTEFENTREKNKPFEFLVGAGWMIPGWEEGVGTMKVGGRRRLFLTPELAFDRRGSEVQGVPPNASLIFEVEVIGLK